MSRIGKQRIEIPEGVTVAVANGTIVVKGPRGALSQEIHDAVTVVVDNHAVTVAPVRKGRTSQAMWGTVRSLVANMIAGVTDGYRKVLELHGVGYRVSAKGKGIELNVGFSHPVAVSPPEGVAFHVDGNDKIIIEGADKQVVGELAAVIRSVRPPEPYKGKGIRYEGEVVRRKVGKRAAGAGAGTGS